MLDELKPGEVRLGILPVTTLPPGRLGYQATSLIVTDGLNINLCLLGQLADGQLFHFSTSLTSRCSINNLPFIRPCFLNGFNQSSIRNRFIGGKLCFLFLVGDLYILDTLNP